MHVTVDSEVIEEGLDYAREQTENLDGTNNHASLKIKAALAHIDNEIQRGKANSPNQNE